MMILIWLSIIIVATIIEIITVDLVSIWFAIGGVGAAIATLLHLSTSIQITFFIVLSFICIILTRPLAKSILEQILFILIMIVLLVIMEWSLKEWTWTLKGKLKSCLHYGWHVHVMVKH